MVLKKTYQQFILCLLLGFASWTCAANNAEQAELDDIKRQLKLIEYRVSVQAGKHIDNSQRYYFDYLKLQQDIKIIKQGINQYLSPVRAQPRDPLVLKGEYLQENKQ